MAAILGRKNKPGQRNSHKNFRTEHKNIWDFQLENILDIITQAGIVWT